MTSSFVPLRAGEPGAQALDPAVQASAAELALSVATTAWTYWRGQPAYTMCLADSDCAGIFLALLNVWHARETRPRAWHVVAVVQEPWSKEALQAWLQACPQAGAAHDRAALLDQWPPVLPGQHRLTFENGAITLTLLYGQPRQALDRAGFSADGLIGGSVDLCAAMARHARARAWWLWADQSILNAASSPSTQPKTDSPSLSSQARDIGQALRQVGFVTSTAAPDGDDPSLVLARRRDDMPVRTPERHPVAQGDRSVVVVGAGIAGASVACALARRGWSVQMVGSTDTHQGHLAAALTPVVARDDNPRARLTRAGARRALAHWLSFGSAVVCRRGTLQLDRPGGRGGEGDETLKALEFPADWVKASDRGQAASLAKCPLARGGVFFPDGLLVRPDKLITALGATAGITSINKTVHLIQASGAGWQALSADGAVVAEAAHVVVAAGYASAEIFQASGMLDDLPHLASMHRLAGEITLLPADALQGGPACVIGGEGYVLPAVDGHVAIGSTYVRGASHATVSRSGQSTNIDKMRALLGSGPDLADGAVGRHGAAMSLDAPSGLYPGWAGWRAVVPGRLPVIGEMPGCRGVWVATGYGSRGLTWAALAADMIAGALEGEPDVLDRDLAKMIAPR